MRCRPLTRTWVWSPNVVSLSNMIWGVETSFISSSRCYSPRLQPNMALLWYLVVNNTVTPSTSEAPVNTRPATHYHTTTSFLVDDRLKIQCKPVQRSSAAYGEEGQSSSPRIVPKAQSAAPCESDSLRLQLNHSNHGHVFLCCQTAHGITEGNVRCLCCQASHDIAEGNVRCFCINLVFPVLMQFIKLLFQLSNMWLLYFIYFNF